ncbi:MAG: DUF3568 family protein [bacterium]
MKSARNAALLSICLGLALQGCALLAAGAGGAAIGAGAVAYREGKLETTYPATLDKTWEAALASLQSLQIPLESTRKDNTGGEIRARRPDETPVTLELETAGPETTRATIRVGLLGDEAVSREISREISSKL